MTDEELRQLQERMKDFLTRSTNPETPPNLEQMKEFMALSDSFMKELRDRGLITEAHLANGGEVGFDLGGSVTKLLHGRR